MVLKGDKLEEVSWDEAFRVMAEGLGKGKKGDFIGMGSPHATNEECYLFKSLSLEILKGKNVDFEVPTWEADDFLIKKENAANPEGARRIGIKSKDGLSVEKTIEEINKGKLKKMYIVGNEIIRDAENKKDILLSLSKLDFLVVQDTHLSDLCSVANVIFPSATFAEKEGTFTNINGRVQKINMAVPPPDKAKSDLEIFGEVARTLGKPFDSVEPAMVMEEIALNVKGFKKVSYDKLGDTGIKITK